MKVTPFGEQARILRMRNGKSLKSMAEALGISSSHLSGIEYGEKTLTDKHIEAALQFFAPHVSADELRDLRDAAAKSKEVVNVAGLALDSRRLVAAFARRLQAGEVPSKDMALWLDSRL